MIDGPRHTWKTDIGTGFIGVPFDKLRTGIGG